MKAQTLKELRELAKARGLKGYSKLSKDELIRRLESKTSPASTAPAPKGTVERARGSRQTSATQATPSAPAMTPVEPPTSETLAPTESTGTETHFASVEERVEGAKYALRPNGRSTSPAAADLDEDIDHLPVLTDPVVCLLPQKPGILHAYWVLPAGEAQRGDYKLRLCQAANDALDIHEEIPVQTDRGSWYFHVSEHANAGLLVQIGYYRDGEFVSASGRSVARLPTLYASSQTDERWWVAETDFARMYLRAGGFAAPARRFGWAASLGSPHGGAGAPEQQRMMWPGGVSSGGMSSPTK